MARLTLKLVSVCVRECVCVCVDCCELVGGGGWGGGLV